MTKLITVGGALLILLVVGSLGLLYVFRQSNPVILCTSLDDSIRPRHHCLMNPFRDTRPEVIAEEYLTQMKEGNLNKILAFVSDENKERIQEAEKKYRIQTWRVGERVDLADRVEVIYWVTRENYRNETTGEDYVENASFFFSREGNELKLETFTAVY
ncbi:MAG: hypothetical protein KF685_04055 [Acidobacteria bacterium]|nr:hypothetical protein [Acidobacteriota bacterium]